ncbi:N-glycosylase/DNA lyase OGG1 [Trifolium repens]|nr:N-glycosylase/DNA lyase OGG1 [Trifolium repens]
MLRKFRKSFIRSRENLPRVSQRNICVQEIEQCRFGIGRFGLGMKGVAYVAVLEVFEGNEVGPNDAGVLGRSSVFPTEGLASGECEG